MFFRTVTETIMKTDPIRARDLDLIRAPIQGLTDQVQTNPILGRALAPTDLVPTDPALTNLAATLQSLVLATVHSLPTQDATSPVFPHAAALTTELVALKNNLIANLVISL